MVDRISDYLLNTNVQLGADYSVSLRSTNRVLAEGPTEAAKLLNATSPDEVLQATFDAIALYEQNLLKPLLSFLTDSIQYERGVRIIGNATADLTRAPTISFVVVGQRPMKSKDIVNSSAHYFQAVDQKGGVRLRGSFPRIIF